MEGPWAPEVHYLFIYWACGPSQERGSVRVGDVFVRGDGADEKKVGFGPKGFGECAKDENFLGRTWLRSWKMD